MSRRPPAGTMRLRCGHCGAEQWEVWATPSEQQVLALRCSTCSTGVYVAAGVVEAPVEIVKRNPEGNPPSSSIALGQRN